MSLDEFWDHYHDHLDEPWGDWTLVNMHAQSAAMFANANRDTKKHPQPYEVRDFLPGEAARREEPPARTEADEIAEFESIMRGAGRQ